MLSFVVILKENRLDCEPASAAVSALFSAVPLLFFVPVLAARLETG